MAGSKGSKFTDPIYDQIEAALERKYNLPKGGMRAVRTLGERSNADQVSEAGAATVYQIIPETRARFKTKYGVDAYSSPEAAAEVAALHLRDSMKRNRGDWNAAVAEYHGGSDRSNWGKRTKAYVSRVTGKDGSTLAYQAERGNPTKVFSEEPLTVDQVWGDAPADYKQDIMTARVSKPRPKPSVVDAVGGTGRIDHSLDQGDFTVANREQREAIAAEKERASTTFGDRVEATLAGMTGTQLALRFIDDQLNEGDPEWHKKWLQNRETFEGWAQSQEEVEALRSDEAQRSFADYMAVQRRLEAKRTRDKIINSNDTGGYFEFAGAMADPVGWVAAAGVGKVLQASKMAGGLARSALEGGGANIAYTAAMDYTGDNQTVSDYVLQGVAGLAMGAALHPVIGKRDTDAAALLAATEQAERIKANEVVSRARAAVGPDAPREAVEAEVARIYVDDMENTLRIALSDVGDDNKFVSADVITATPGKEPAVSRKEVIERHNLEVIEDPVERNIVAEIVARSEIMDAANPVDAAALQGRLLKATIGESTGLTMMRSESPVLRAFARQALEVTTGAGGRRRTAALAQVQRERFYLREMIEHEQLYNEFRRGQGVGVLRAAASGDVLREFDRRVFYEVERRQGTPKGVSFDENAAVRRAADNWERGMERMRIEAQHVGTLGHERLGTTSRGYMRHMIHAGKLANLSKQERAGVENVLAKQFSTLNEYSYIDDAGERITKAFDAKFAKRLAKGYLTKAQRRANGTYDVPANIHSSEGADIVSDVIREMKGLSAKEKESLLGKFSRGGAAFTKGRLKLDLTEEVVPGLKLGDIFRQDIMTLYQGYARRMSGEVALAQHGIYGTQGLRVIREAAERTGATKQELDALEQVGSEFLNVPFGNHRNHAWLDNLSIATSAAKLGGMGFTQAAEYGNGLAAVGFQGVSGAIREIPAMIRDVRSMRAGKGTTSTILKDFDEVIGPIGMDGYQTTRLFNFGPDDVNLYNDEAVGRFGRGLRSASHATSVLSGHRIISAVQTRGMAEQIVKKAIRYINRGEADKALLDMGFTDDIQKMLRDSMSQIAKFDSKGRLVNLDLHAADLDPNLVKKMADAVERGSSQIIQRTYIGETGKWAHDSVLKFLLKFRTFGVTSIEKQWGRNVANMGAVKTFSIIMGSMAFALPIHMARMQLRSTGMSEQEYKKFAEASLTPLAIGRATLNYASATGLLTDAIDLGGTFGGNVGLLPQTVGDQLAGNRAGGRAATVQGLVPGIGMANDILQLPSGKFDKLPKVLPGGNLPFATPLFTMITPDKEE